MSDGDSPGRADGEDTDPATEYQFDPAVESASEAVVSAVAEAADVDPTDLPPIYAAIDPDALDTLFSGDVGGGSIRLSFSYAGYDVFLSGGTVTVDRRRE